MLTQLSVYDLRNLHNVSIKVGQCNIFIGANGSGKTSLLESLYLLSRGKSFRHHQPKRYISHHAPSTTVHAKFADGNSIAIQKEQDASTSLRLGQQTVYVQSALTKQLPTLLIDPSSMDILEVGSSSRRQLLDWITFHVKQGFHSQWVAYQRLLKQRNAILRQSNILSVAQKQELAAWDKGLATHAALITHYRQQAFEEWMPLFEQLIGQLLPEYAPFIQLRFSPGYNTDLPLDELLQLRLEQDCQTGYTRVGCHRADVQVLWVDNADTRLEVEALQQQNPTQQRNTEDITQAGQAANLQDDCQKSKQIDLGTDSVVLGGQGLLTDNNQTLEAKVQGNVREQAANVLSRGEKKLLITALKLSQLPLLIPSNLTSSNSVPSSLIASTDANEVQYDIKMDNAILPIVLLDDITAELDSRAQTILLKTLADLPCQVFITSLNDTIMKEITDFWPEAQVFHVKQGSISLATG